MKSEIIPAFYIRVSKRAQRFDSQERELRSYARRMGWKKPIVYREKRPGAKAPRTVLDQLMTDARSGRFNLVAVYKLDRLGRSLSHLLQIINELASLKVSIVSISQGFDTSPGNPSGRLMLSLIGAFAEFERELIQERTLAGVESAKRRGVRLGKPPLPDEIRRKVLELRNPVQGPPMKLTEIARKLKVSLGYVHKVTVSRENRFHKSPPLKTADSPEGA